MTAPEVRQPPGGTADAAHNNTRDDILALSQEACIARVQAADKAIATLRARAALAGVELYIIGNDGRAEYLAARWGWTKAFTSIDAFEVWLDRFEGRPC